MAVFAWGVLLIMEEIKEFETPSTNVIRQHQTAFSGNDCWVGNRVVISLPLHLFFVQRRRLMWWQWGGPAHALSTASSKRRAGESSCGPSSVATWRSSSSTTTLHLVPPPPSGLSTTHPPTSAHAPRTPPSGWPCRVVACVDSPPGTAPTWRMRRRGGERIMWWRGSGGTS